MAKFRGYIIGTLIGLIIGLSTTTYADTIGELIGSKVDSTLGVNLSDKPIGEAPVINGVSYLPVRTIADSMNFEVEVTDGMINLVPATELPDDPALSNLVKEKDQIERELAEINSELARVQSVIDRNITNKNNYPANIVQINLDKAKKLMAESQAKKIQLQKDLDAVNAKIAELDK